MLTMYVASCLACQLTKILHTPKKIIGLHAERRKKPVCTPKIFGPKNKECTLGEKKLEKVFFS